MKHTKGDISQYTEPTKGKRVVGVLDNNETEYGDVICTLNRDNDCYLDNGKLITEAFNVANETGFTPRQLADRYSAKCVDYRIVEKAIDLAIKENKQLAEQKAELLEALKLAKHHLILDFDATDKILAPIFKAIQNATS